jgi:hypothetical protein
MEKEERLALLVIQGMDRTRESWRIKPQVLRSVVKSRI